MSSAPHHSSTRRLTHGFATNHLSSCDDCISDAQRICGIRSSQVVKVPMTTNGIGDRIL